MMNGRVEVGMASQVVGCGGTDYTAPCVIVVLGQLGVCCLNEEIKGDGASRKPYSSGT